MSKQIRITIRPDGTIESETVGVKGKSCLSYIKEIEQLTNAKTVKSAFTQEYYQSEAQNYDYNEEQQDCGN